MPKLSKKTRALLEGKNFAYIATVNRDGSPQVTPVWIDTDGKNVLVNTALGRIKQKNVARDPRVAIAVFDFSNQYAGSFIRGRVAKTITGKKAEDHIDYLSFKYTGNRKYAGRNSKERRVILVIEPTHVSER